MVSNNRLKKIIRSTIKTHLRARRNLPRRINKQLKHLCILGCPPHPEPDIKSIPVFRCECSFDIVECGGVVGRVDEFDLDVVVCGFEGLDLGLDCVGDGRGGAVFLGVFRGEVGV